jgi:hypothetical protein
VTIEEVESSKYWSSFSVGTLAETCAEVHRDRRRICEASGSLKVEGARVLVGNAFIKGTGIEVGAGNRPFPLPAGASVIYGDVRNENELKIYFSDEFVHGGQTDIDAQTFQGIAPSSLDFIISAHVIEHLFDPIGAICSGVNCLKASGVYVVIVPNKTYTFDHQRPATSWEHLKRDSLDGGASTKLEAYVEHMSFVHPLMAGPVTKLEIIEGAKDGVLNNRDIHVHSWTFAEFKAHLENMIADGLPAILEFSSSVENESIFVLRRGSSAI